MSRAESGTVPALRFGREKIQTNREIARFLERTRPDPPLFQLEGARRHAVEEAERWGDEVLQMSARRIVLAAAQRGLQELRDRGGRGRDWVRCCRSTRRSGSCQGAWPPTSSR